ncbi:DUF1983 domain-containing protein [Shewanella sp. 202IG2-18]|uniref:phage tail tip fiber protein n=1 Tax=Parashewanella hymeniacidonis TaxID=2807618 RepID=UPI00195FFBF9|nr:DUF1983 domain-containing protein [Parashewanella hymeniacidonis]MBM7070871.1 DUF1983 domain-containing protein [Parashewanella hymeniacidonis]
MAERSPFSGIPKRGRVSPEQEAVAENIEILTGQRGKEHRALLYSDLVDLDRLKRQALVNSVTKPIGSLPQPPVGTIERPHAPVNLSGRGGFTFIAITWSKPTYRGHAYAEIFRAEENNFSKAVRIATASADVFSDSVQMGSTYFYWVRFVNVADMKGPTQGVNGIEVSTQESAEVILDTIGGQIEESHLGDFLTGEIGKIPGLGEGVGSINDALAGINDDINQTKIDFNQELESVNAAVEQVKQDSNQAVNDAKTEIENAKQRVGSIELAQSSLADDLIQIAVGNDVNWRNNATKLLEVETSIGETRAKLDAEVYTKAEATEAIAAAAQTVRAEVEAAGVPLDGTIEDTYYTIATADEAIAIADQQLKASIEDPNGNSVAATLKNQYYTSVKTDEAISVATQALKAAIEDPKGNSIGATLVNDYLTQVDFESSLAQSLQTLQAEIESPNGDSLGATLQTKYYTKVDVDSSISGITDILDSFIENPEGSELGAGLTRDFYTKVTANEAIANASQLLQSAIEDPQGNSVGATLFNDYYTKTDSDQAIARQLFELNSSYDPAFEGMIENALANDQQTDRQRVVNASISRKQETLSNAQEATAESVEQLSANFNSSQADITEFKKTVAKDKLASAQQRVELNAGIEGVAANLSQNYLTKVETELAFSALNTELSSEIGDLSATLEHNYFTKTETSNAISAVNESLSSSIGNVNANLENNYLTEVETNKAISNLSTQLSSEIEGVSSNLSENYYTKTENNEALSALSTELNSSISGVSDTVSSLASTLSEDYYTKTDTDSAIAAINQELSSKIDGVDEGLGYLSATLTNQYYTKTDTDSAISIANQVLESSIGDNSAALQTLSQTVAENNDDVWALWGVKTEVNGLTSSIGLINDGSDPKFVVQGAKFAVINGNDSLTPVFSVSGGKSVMNTALIDQAFIKTLVTDDVLANRLMVGSRLTTPSINYNPSTGARSNNFSISPNGTMHCNHAELKSVTIRDNSGSVVMSSGGSISHGRVSGLGSLATQNGVSTSQVSGLQNAVTTFIDSAHINSLFGGSAIFTGKIYANKIEGDLVDADVLYIPQTAVAAKPIAWRNLIVFRVKRNPNFDQVLTVPFSAIRSPQYLNYTYGNSACDFRLNNGQQGKESIVIPKGSGSFSVSIKIKLTQDVGTSEVGCFATHLTMYIFRKSDGFIV